MPSRSRSEGYLLIDNRGAEGVSEDVIRASGKQFVCAPAGGVLEAAVNTCCHCQTQVIRNPDRVRPRNYCRSCDQYVCDDPNCNDQSFHLPVAKLFDTVQENTFRVENDMQLLNIADIARRLRQWGLSV